MPRPLNWKKTLAQIEDLLVPLLRLSSGERALYYLLLRLTHLEGKRRIHISRRALARRGGFSINTVRSQAQRLAQKKCLRLLRRSLDGVEIELFLPAEIPACRARARRCGRRELEQADWFHSDRHRAAILRRERERCFYCLSELPPGAERFDHVVARRSRGNNSYRNIVACCFECNSRKSGLSAREFLRLLLRKSRLSSREFAARLRALRDLRAGKLVPQIVL
jgi:5-methylcytosine-specific restriction endonuclease McrA